MLVWGGLLSEPAITSMLTLSTDQGGALISPLRIAGIVAGVAFLGFVLWRASTGSASRLDSLLGVLIALALAVVSAFPGLVSFLFGPFSFAEGEGFPRLIGLLVAAVLFLLFYQFVQTSSITNNRRELTALVRELAIERYLGEVRPQPIPEVLVVIPAYNEEDALGDVLSQIPSRLHGLMVEPVVVVDGATDNTRGVAQRFGIPAVHATNRGQSAALVTGYEIARRRGAQIVAAMDADGQMVAAELEQVIGPVADGSADLVSGSRVLGTHHGDRGIRSLGVRLFGLLLTVLLRQRVTDPSIGMRAIRVSRLEQMRLREERFGAAELLVEAHRRGLRIREVPVTILPRSAGETRKPPALSYGVKFARAIILSWLR